MPQGYLAQVLNVPPLIFKFQYNPELLQERKSYQYQQANDFGRWNFDRKEAGTGLGTLTGAWDDIKEIGARLTATKPLEPVEGEPRTFDLDFALDGESETPGTEHRYGGDIKPDLEILRSFMHPKIEILKIGEYFSATPPCHITPPLCFLRYGGVSAECVMTDLRIRMTEFDPEGDPRRAEVTVTLKEQSYSTGTVTDFFVRNGYVVRSYFREGIVSDALYASPAGPVVDLF